MAKSNIIKTAQELLAKGKGILAADESFPSIKKRFIEHNIVDNEESHSAYRELLFSTPEIEKYISGVIMFDETIKQKTDEGVPFPQYLSYRKIIPGIKVDQGTTQFRELSDEKITLGLDGLSERLSEYRSLGAKFTKWRGIFNIGKDLPTEEFLEENTKLLAEYAFLSQKNELLPIVEPEVLMTGIHTSADCLETTSKVLSIIFKKLRKRKVLLSGLLLKINMIVPGDQSEEKVTPEIVAKNTLECLIKNVPKEVPGIVFLSGGQTEQDATSNLNAIAVAGKKMPWKFTFSYGRALQNSVLRTWAGKPGNVILAQQIFLKRSRLNSLASLGKYHLSDEQEQI